MDEEELSPVNGGLILPRNIGVGRSIVENTGKLWNTLPDVEEHLKELKVPDLTEPTVEPPNITAELLLTPNPKEYTVMFASARVWYGYATRLLARTNAALLEVTNQIANLEPELRKKLRDHNRLIPKDQRMSVGELDDEVAVDKDLQGLKLTEQKLKQYKLELTAWHEDLDRQLKLVSRQVEIRREDNAGGRNEQNMPGRQNGSWSGMRTPSR
jgi:hypothetical protein